MTWIDAFWHFANWFASGLGVGVMMALLCKIVWRNELRNVGWWPVMRAAVLMGWVGTFAGLLVSGGRDGRMAVHALTVVGVVVGVWWAGFVRPARR